MKIVLATSNLGKLKEIRALLQDHHQISNQAEYDIPAAPENGNSFAENALQKARHASRLTRLTVIADDSGLEVDYLGGKPGIHSARYGGENATDQENIDKLLSALRGVPTAQRNARFHCVIALLKDADDPAPALFHGCWEGRIADEPMGNNGFGYDAVFYIPDLGYTSAELPATIKNKYSHRGQALRQLRQYLI